MTGRSVNRGSPDLGVDSGHFWVIFGSFLDPKMANSYGRECRLVQKVPAQALALFGAIPKGSKIGPFLGQFWTPFLGLNRSK